MKTSHIKGLLRLSAAAFTTSFVVVFAQAQSPAAPTTPAATAPAKSAATKPAPAKPAPKKAAERSKTNFCKPESKGTPVKVKLTTSMGAMTLELDNEKAPISAENFIKYVESGHYNGTIFHRVIDGFMIQGGGFTKDMQQKPTNAQIKNESTNGLKNDLYTVAMARTGVRDSATSQFFINIKNNDFLNYSGENPQGWGYAVFGKVIEGTEVVDKMRAVKTGNNGPHQNVPTDPIIIEKAECVQ
jgi:peptidyl-prolyl cis-trans isomerase B (cyclophilin B)